MPTFTNQDNQALILHPPGDYVFRVVGMESGIQAGTGKTAGSPFWELKLAVEDKGGVVFERLIDHPTCSWKIDTFLKSANAAPPVGTPFEFEEDAAESSGCLWINPVGLRGWCSLLVDEYTRTGSQEKAKRNRVGVFYTDKPKLARAETPKVAAPMAAVATEGTTETEDEPF